MSGCRPGLAAQLVGLLVVGAALGALVPRTSMLAGLAGGFLAWTAVAASRLVRVRWLLLSQRHPHWSRYGTEVVTAEVVRTGVGLLVVLFTVAPFALGADVLPDWALAAVTAGVAAALPVGVAVELRARGTAVHADRRRPWRIALGVASAGLACSLLVALPGHGPSSRAFAWTAAALAAFGLTAWIRGSQWAPQDEQ